MVYSMAMSLRGVSYNGVYQWVCSPAELSCIYESRPRPGEN